MTADRKAYRMRHDAVGLHIDTSDGTTELVTVVLGNRFEHAWRRLLRRPIRTAQREELVWVTQRSVKEPTWFEDKDEVTA